MRRSVQIELKLTEMNLNEKADERLEVVVTRWKQVIKRMSDIYMYISTLIAVNKKHRQQ